MTDDDILEGAWQALEAGDVEAARRGAARKGQDDPEALLLLAACCREQGDVPGAIALLERAVDKDAEWASPELWLAELHALEPATFGEALRHAERALDLADEEGEYLSALALKAGLEAEGGDPEAARRTLADLPPAEVALGNPDAALEIADLHLALGDTELARARLRTLAEGEPDSAEAWYALGCVAAELGDEEEMRAAWKRTWTIDSRPAASGAEGVLERRLSDAEVAEIAEAALGELPERARNLLRGIPIVIVEQPAEADVDTGLDPRALGLFSGTAHPDDSHLGGQPGLTQILLYRRSLERTADSVEELREEIRTTMLHEAGHFFGLDDAELEEAGLG